MGNGTRHRRHKEYRESIDKLKRIQEHEKSEAIDEACGKVLAIVFLVLQDKFDFDFEDFNALMEEMTEYEAELEGKSLDEVKEIVANKIMKQGEHKDGMS